MSVNENQSLADAPMSEVVSRAAKLAYEAALAEARLLRAEASAESQETLIALRTACEQAHAAMAGAHNDVFAAICRPPAGGWRNKRDYFTASQNAGSRAFELIAEAKTSYAGAEAHFHSAREDFLYGPDRGSEQTRAGLFAAIRLLEESAAE